MVYTNYLWWLGGWFIIAIPTLCWISVPHSPSVACDVSPWIVSSFGVVPAPHRYGSDMDRSIELVHATADTIWYSWYEKCILASDHHCFSWNCIIVHYHIVTARIAESLLTGLARCWPSAPHSDLCTPASEDHNWPPLTHVEQCQTMLNLQILQHNVPIDGSRAKT